ncbi:hypothetical protein MAAFP003_1030 [Mycobacterium ahvazicum]|uniref:Uncharacterized protein n=1 Tax=Mycobacterium ahvazicum TaxID=1964395 RepID=A0A2K4Y6E8_9MYCO|nr:hypothetical protein [Mycobacterium ahvazicum]SOX52364.1 hypothetical protein MAAFP003_1030 [Mycobacterium ahvazicum]
MSRRTFDDRIGASALAFVAYTAVMLVLERRMRATGGPGIIRFELAGSASRAEAIMAAWGGDGRRAAAISTWLDFGYMASYGNLLALLVERTRRRCGHPAGLPALVGVAVAGDAVEGVSLLNVLRGNRVADNARRARTAALIKFAVLVVWLAYIAVGSMQPSAQERGVGDL